MEVFDYMTVSVQATRLFTLFALITLYFCLRNSAEHYGNDDAEQQSLIRKKLAPKPFSSEGSAQSTNGYGTAASQTSENSNAESVEEDRYTKRQRETLERVEKRLKNDGNWWTYAKGFAVRLYALLLGATTYLRSRFSSHTSGQFIVGLCSLGHFLLDVVCCQQTPSTF
jgi:hypothetical protein